MAFGARRRRLIENGQAGLTHVGAEADRAVRRISALATQNRVPFRAHAPGSPEVLTLAERCGVKAGHGFAVPGKGSDLREPTRQALARRLGLELGIEAGAASVVVATGVPYLCLPLSRSEEFEGAVRN